MTATQAAATRPEPGIALRDLRMVGRQVGYEQLSFWLNPLAAIFTVGFSVVFLVLLGASAGSSRVHFLGNIKLIQYYVPGFVAYNLETVQGITAGPVRRAGAPRAGRRSGGRWWRWPSSCPSARPSPG